MSLVFALRPSSSLGWNSATWMVSGYQGYSSARRDVIVHLGFILVIILFCDNRERNGSLSYVCKKKCKQFSASLKFLYLKKKNYVMSHWIMQGQYKKFMRLLQTLNYDGPRIPDICIHIRINRWDCHVLHPQWHNLLVLSGKTKPLVSSSVWPRLAARWHCFANLDSLVISWLLLQNVH